MRALLIAITLLTLVASAKAVDLEGGFEWETTFDPAPISTWCIFPNNMEDNDQPACIKK